MNKRKQNHEHKKRRIIKKRFSKKNDLELTKTTLNQRKERNLKKKNQ